MKLSTYQISFTFGGLTIQATKKLTPNKFKKIFKKMQNANYIVRDCQSKKVVNFYSTKLARALFFAHECKRDMKAMSGRDHEVLVKVDGQDYLLTEEEFNGLANEEN
jgi:predicted nucleic-acid-binding Zn-ribbon protein